MDNRYDDIKIEILNRKLETIGLAIGNLQEYDTEVQIEDYKFTVTKRLFVEYIEKKIDMTTYLKIDTKLYKTLKVKEFSDYMEIWLYELKRQV